MIVRVEAWSDGDRYERFMGRWSAPVADAFLSWIDMPVEGRWLDVGCGTGALSAAILARCRPSHLAGIDASADFVAGARRRLGQGPDLRVGDARSLPFPDNDVDAAVSGLCLNFVDDPLDAVSEMHRVSRPGGIVAVYVWDYRTGMEMLRRFWDVAVALDPTAADLDEGARFPLCDRTALARLFAGAGLQSVDTAALTTPTTFSSFDDFWDPFLGGQGPAPGYVASLPVDDRDHLADALRHALPGDDDGVIRLTARALAVKGVAAGV